MGKISVGLDIGISSIKLVALSKQGNSFKMVSLGSIPCPQPGMLSDADVDLEAVANAIRLLKLPNDIKESLRGGILSRAHARALLAFGDEAKQREVYGHILGGRLSSKDVEQMASSSKLSKSKKSKLSSQEVNRFQALEKNLGEMLKVPVLIRSTDKGGHIDIKFSTLQELNKVAKKIID